MKLINLPQYELYLYKHRRREEKQENVGGISAREIGSSIPYFIKSINVEEGPWKENGKEKDWKWAMIIVRDNNIINNYLAFLLPRGVILSEIYSILSPKILTLQHYKYRRWELLDDLEWIENIINPDLSINLISSFPDYHKKPENIREGIRKDLECGRFFSVDLKILNDGSSINDPRFLGMVDVNIGYKVSSGILYSEFLRFDSSKTIESIYSLKEIEGHFKYYLSRVGCRNIMIQRNADSSSNS